MLRHATGEHVRYDILDFTKVEFQVSRLSLT